VPFGSPLKEIRTSRSSSASCRILIYRHPRASMSARRSRMRRITWWGRGGWTRTTVPSSAWTCECEVSRALSVVSTSVLPSAGTANPTFLMLCLAEEFAESFLGSPE
jgi:hypothetical protein